MAIALSRSPTYLGATHLLPVVDALCALSEVERLTDIDCDIEIAREAMCMSMIGIDIPLSEAKRTVSRLIRHLIRTGGDATTALSSGSDAEVRSAVQHLLPGDPCQSQYLMDCANLDIRATPTGGATGVAVKLGLVHFGEGLFGFDHLRSATRTALDAHPVEVWHALQFLSDAVCDAHLGCTSCVCNQTCRALCEGWI